MKSALLAIQKGKPEAVIMVGPYKPCAEFIKLARENLRFLMGEAPDPAVIEAIVAARDRSRRTPAERGSATVAGSLGGRGPGGRDRRCGVPEGVRDAQSTSMA